MLPGNRRLPPTEIPHVSRTGQRVRSGPLDIRISPASGRDALCAVIVPKKTDARATMRNRLKRIVSSALQSLLRTESVHHDVVVIVRSSELSGAQEAEGFLRSVLCGEGAR